MPGATSASGWEVAAREQVRALAKGWTVVSMRGQIQLKLREPGTTSQTVVLSFVWSKSSWGDAYVRIRNIYALVQEGYTLKQAAEVAAGKAPKLIEQHDWHGAMERFKQQKLSHGTAIKPETW